MLNRCQVVGNLCADPEIRSVGSGKVANLRVAVNEQWRDKNSGEKREKTEFVPCVAWGHLAEVIETLGVRKGDRVFFEGKFQSRKWQDQNGGDHYVTEIVAQGFDGKFIAMTGRPTCAKKATASDVPEDVSTELDDSIPF